jgi:hypothetical protein
VKPERAQRDEAQARPGRISQGRTPIPDTTRLPLKGILGNHALCSMLEQQIPATPTPPLQRKDRPPASGQPAADPQPGVGAQRLPDNVRSGIETLSGLSLGDVEVHYNSALPARFHALAYTRGRAIHVAPGQERHLPHEAWHVVQQAQGRVAPTTQMKSGVPVNNDRKLEREADVMGERALALGRTHPKARTDPRKGPADPEGDGPVQRYAEQNNAGHLFAAGALVVHTTDLVLRADRLNKPTAGDLSKHPSNAGKEEKGKKGSTWKAGTNTGQSLISNVDNIPEGKRKGVKIVKSIPASLQIRQTGGLHHAELVTTKDMSTTQIGAAVNEVELTDQYDEAVAQLAAE